MLKNLLVNYSMVTPYLTQSYLLLLCFTNKLYGLLLLYRDDKEWVFYTVRTQEGYIYLEKERFQWTIEIMPIAYCALLQRPERVAAFIETDYDRLY